uniref:Uncharacterized protein n=1 Tax=Theropithecus gelada TaxID=9565 RepID=A0A8D2FHZ2_THEGE
MASISQLACISSDLILHSDEVTVTEDNVNWKQRKKNPRGLMMTWALVFE